MACVPPLDKRGSVFLLIFLKSHRTQQKSHLPSEAHL
uniref:Uncharacterized protein n=1 Tax=Anguilla anguilla TaxID=7936 RepID=A0A0E9SC40_ANGAN